MTEPILGNKEWKDRTLEEKVERLLRVHDHNALALAEDEKRIEEIVDHINVAFHLLEERVEKLEERAKIATDAEVLQALREGRLEISLRKCSEAREEDMDTLRE